MLDVERKLNIQTDTKCVIKPSNKLGKAKIAK